MGNKTRALFELLKFSSDNVGKAIDELFCSEKDLCQAKYLFRAMSNELQISVHINL